MKDIGNVPAASYQETAGWASHVVKNDERDAYIGSDNSDFVRDDAFDRLLRRIDDGSILADKTRVRDIIATSMSIRSLSAEDTAVLMSVTDPDLLEEMRAAAEAIKLKVYDKRIVTFAPLYLSNRCVNACVYCGFRESNDSMLRRRLDMDTIRSETEALCRDFGHKRLVVVFGEHPDSDVDYMVKAIDTIYTVQVPTRKGHANIRRVNVNAAPMEKAKLEKLREVGMGTYQVFQETYDRNLYARMHPGRGPKSDFRWRLYCMHRAMEAGIEDVGIGALFGLGDWRFEVLGLLAHTQELEARFSGVGAHTISFPRLEPASNVRLDKRHRVSDTDFLRLITILRLAVPYAGLICTAREPALVRNAAVRRGITQMDASTRIGLGAYSERQSEQEIERQQFLLGDTRSLEDLIGDLADMGCITSFCTAGYRVGRTGDRIMRMLRDCSEGNFCKLNAILTFREWLDDFAGPEVRAKGEALIARELTEARTRLPQFMKAFEPMYKKTLHGCRDLYL